jgi:hypothetical protein
MLDQNVTFKTLYTILRMEEEKSLVHHKVGCPLRSTGFLSSIAIPSGCKDDILVWKSIFFIGVLHLFFLPVSIVHLSWKPNTWLCIILKNC